ncbi:MAG: hypothetical protein FVQ84_22665 [Planctomycetes bacterium]|nr:hypothetical protein [Planctomycetota bacterium]
MKWHSVIEWLGEARRAYAVLGSRNRLEALVSANLGHEVDVPAAVDFFHRVIPIHYTQPRPTAQFRFNKER